MAPGNPAYGQTVFRSTSDNLSTSATLAHTFLHGPSVPGEVLIQISRVVGHILPEPVRRREILCFGGRLKLHLHHHQSFKPPLEYIDLGVQRPDRSAAR